MSNETDRKMTPGFADEQAEFERARVTGAGNDVLRARPAKGEIDHAALTHRIIAKFPKILAALAK